MPIEIIIHKTNRVTNILSLLRKLRELENDCLHRVTFEAMKEPDYIAEYIEEDKLILVTNPTLQELLNSK